MEKINSEKNFYLNNNIKKDDINNKQKRELEILNFNFKSIEIPQQSNNFEKSPFQNKLFTNKKQADGNSSSNYNNNNNDSSPINNNRSLRQITLFPELFVANGSPMSRRIIDMESQKNNSVQHRVENRKNIQQTLKYQQEFNKNQIKQNNSCIQGSQEFSSNTKIQDLNQQQYLLPILNIEKIDNLVASQAILSNNHHKIGINISLNKQNEVQSNQFNNQSSQDLEKTPEKNDSNTPKDKQLDELQKFKLQSDQKSPINILQKKNVLSFYQNVRKIGQSSDIFNDLNQTNNQAGNRKYSYLNYNQTNSSMEISKQNKFTNSVSLNKDRHLKLNQSAYLLGKTDQIQIDNQNQGNPKETMKQYHIQNLNMIILGENNNKSESASWIRQNKSLDKINKNKLKFEQNINEFTKETQIYFQDQIDEPMNNKNIVELIDQKKPDNMDQIQEYINKQFNQQNEELKKIKNMQQKTTTTDDDQINYLNLFRMIGKYQETQQNFSSTSLEYLEQIFEILEKENNIFKDAIVIIHNQFQENILCKDNHLYSMVEDLTKVKYLVSMKKLRFKEVADIFYKYYENFQKEWIKQQDLISKELQKIEIDKIKLKTEYDEFIKISQDTERKNNSLFQTEKQLLEELENKKNSVIATLTGEIELMRVQARSNYQKFQQEKTKITESVSQEMILLQKQNLIMQNQLNIQQAEIIDIKNQSQVMINDFQRLQSTLSEISNDQQTLLNQTSIQQNQIKFFQKLIGLSYEQLQSDQITQIAKEKIIQMVRNFKKVI